jgi:hypothetical protein
MTLITHGVVISTIEATFHKIGRLFVLLGQALAEARAMKVERDVARHRRIHDLAPRTDDLRIMRR